MEQKDFQIHRYRKQGRLSTWRLRGHLCSSFLFSLPDFLFYFILFWGGGFLSKTTTARWLKLAVPLQQWGLKKTFVHRDVAFSTEPGNTMPGYMFMLCQCFFRPPSNQLLPCQHVVCKPWQRLVTAANATQFPSGIFFICSSEVVSCSFNPNFPLPFQSCGCAPTYLCDASYSGNLKVERIKVETDLWKRWKWIWMAK